MLAAVAIALAALLARNRGINPILPSDTGVMAFLLPFVPISGLFLVLFFWGKEIGHLWTEGVWLALASGICSMLFVWYLTGETGLADSSLSASASVAVAPLATLIYLRATGGGVECRNAECGVTLTHGMRYCYEYGTDQSTLPQKSEHVQERRDVRMIAGFRPFLDLGL